MRFLLMAAVAAVLGGCAGRDPQQIASVQASDVSMDCAAIAAEIETNNQHLAALQAEQNDKMAQNVVAGVAGAFIPVLYLGMDLKFAAYKDAQALQLRQQSLTTLAAQRCGRR